MVFELITPERAAHAENATHIYIAILTDGGSTTEHHAPNVRDLLAAAWMRGQSRGHRAAAIYDCNTLAASVVRRLLNALATRLTNHIPSGSAC